jgi:hypothetical protein
MLAIGENILEINRKRSHLLKQTLMTSKHLKPQNIIWCRNVITEYCSIACVLEAYSK